MERNEINVTMVALGCSKNLVDAECMVKSIKDHGYNIVEDMADADVAVINTCGFIESAKTEAIRAILDAADYKADGENHGKLQHIIVSGCLPQRYSGDILKELPEVDIVLGTSHYKDICTALDSLYESETFTNSYVSEAGGLEHMRDDRELSTSGYAWLKIGEGCLHKCAFCAIPLIRGKFVSRPMEDILEDAKNIAAKGVKEIILAAQDTTNYGIDNKSRSLPLLLHKLSEIEGIEVIRVMYGYLDGITDELIEEIASNPKVANYLDIPIQHGDDAILKAMKRHETADKITERLEKLRARIPNLIVRTTVMVGFPGETEESFNNLVSNLKKWKFDRLGCFIFSPEEGTLAYDMPDQVPEDIKQARFDIVYETQQQISLESNNARIGSEVIVTIDSVSDDGIFYVGRSYGEAPEVDPVIYVASTREEELVVGCRYKVKILEASEYEMTGVTV
ncbi:MAG: 30S ribosomal protein S12 methylthiotransferase RimO [Saccharofermentans sp.]|nr:30S ribosomal protein S12 methylthiotransferase RimO [Saccharofermentans sp.]